MWMDTGACGKVLYLRWGDSRSSRSRRSRSRSRSGRSRSRSRSRSRLCIGWCCHWGRGRSRCFCFRSGLQEIWGECEK
jgi:hypothetical protein